MHPRRQSRLWMLAGVLLDVAGAALVVTSIESGGTVLILGVALLVAGSILVFRGVLRASSQHQKAGENSEFAQEWAPEPGLQQAPPRAVRLSRAGRRVVLSWILMGLAVVAFLWVQALQPGEEQQRLTEYGVETVGEIHDKALRSVGEGSDGYYLHFHFQDRGGSRVRASIRVAPHDYESVEVGDAVQVVYLPEDPLVHTLPRFSSSRAGVDAWPWVLPGVGALLLVFEWHRRKHRRLVSHGKPLPGRIVSLTRRGAVRAFTVEYRIDGRTGTLRGSDRDPRIKAGDPLTVLYLPEKPAEAMLYRTSLYRAV